MAASYHHHIHTSVPREESGCSGVSCLGTRQQWLALSGQAPIDSSFVLLYSRDCGFFPFHLTSSTMCLPRNQDSIAGLWVHAEFYLEIFLCLIGDPALPSLFSCPCRLLFLIPKIPQQLLMVFLLFSAVTWLDHSISSPSLKLEKAQNRGLSLQALSHSTQPYPYHVPGL